MTHVTAESPDDMGAIRAVHRAAFDSDDEAELVARLCEAETFDPSLSLVARDGERVVGHALLTPLDVDTDDAGGDGDVGCLVLAPVGVVPSRQGKGIGSELVRASLERARSDGWDAVFLHGSPAFYPRFGFRPAGERGFENPFDTPPEEFMVAVLGDRALSGGRLRYPAAFDAL